MRTVWEFLWGLLGFAGIVAGAYVVFAIVFLIIDVRRDKRP